MDQEKNKILLCLPSGKNIHSQCNLPRFKPLLSLRTGMKVEGGNFYFLFNNIATSSGMEWELIKGRNGVLLAKKGQMSC